jgi:hypothetical protein
MTGLDSLGSGKSFAVMDGITGSDKDGINQFQFCPKVIIFLLTWFRFLFIMRTGSRRERQRRTVANRR